MRLIVLIILCGLFLASCDTERVYQYDHEFKGRAWNIADTAFFDFTIRDINKKYNVFYSVRNTLDYPYARLFVQYSLGDSVEGTMQKKLISEFLFDQKSGRPSGTSGLGDVYDHQFSLLNNYEFRHPGRYRIALQQFMRLDTLKGILAVGVRVEFASKK